MKEKDILDSAIDIEEKGIAYYAGLAHKADNMYARLFFERMVEEEEEHKEILEGALAKIEGGGKVEMKLGEIPEDKVFPEDAKQVGGGYVEAIQHALKLEEKNLEFYIQASEKTSEPGLRRLYDWLIDFEQQHVNRLAAELEFIENTAGSSELG